MGTVREVETTTCATRGRRLRNRASSGATRFRDGANSDGRMIVYSAVRFVHGRSSAETIAG